MSKQIQHGWSIVFVCIVIGFIMAMQARQEKDAASTVPKQRIEELSVRLVQMQEERNALKNQLMAIEKDTSQASAAQEINEKLKLQACLLPLEGTGLIIRMDDSTREAKSGENPNLYLIHDDDLLRVINELRAAGAEALSINGQRLIDTSEIRCAGPTLSVNNVRSSAPYEIHAIGDKKTLENAVKMRGGVAETLKVWGIQLEVESSNSVYIPPYKGTHTNIYGHIVAER